MKRVEPRIQIEDETHLLAHQNDMWMTREEVLKLIRKELRYSRQSGEVRRTIRCTRKVGLTGLKRLLPGEKKSFWMPREGRSIPSHLIYGKKKSTRFLAVWGYWCEPDLFIITTYYPGKPAPREPHDPNISREELKAAVLFWAKHAIVLDPGQE